VARARCQGFQASGRAAPVRTAPTRVNSGPFPISRAGSAAEAATVCQALSQAPRAPTAARKARAPRIGRARGDPRMAQGSHRAGTLTIRTSTPHPSSPRAAGPAPQGSIVPASIRAGPSIRKAGEGVSAFMASGAR
jgi:hypothetical protein